jgi:hypothetical protein
MLVVSAAVESAYKVNARLNKNEAKRRMLVLMAQGHKVSKAAVMVGRTYQRYREWRVEDPAFARQADMIRMRKGDVTGLDFVNFRKTYFDRDTPWHHQKIIEAFEHGAAPRSITMILAPPNTGKTSLVEDWICYKLGENPDYRIAVISEGEDHARKIVGHVAKRMTDDTQFAAYIDRYGPFKAPDRDAQRRWNMSTLQVLRAKNDERDYSLEAHGAGGRIYGSRFDLMILDDIQSTQNLNATEKLMRYFLQDVYTRPDDTGRFIILGTRVDANDIYDAFLQREGLVDTLVKLPAIDEDGCSIWPERFSVESYRRTEIDVGPEIWARVYQQQPYSPRDQTFTDEIIETALDRNRVLGDQPGVGTMFGLDPALGGWCALTTCSFDAHKLYLVDQEAQKQLARTADIVAMIRAHASKYRPTIGRVEINAFQKSMMYDEQLTELGRQLGFRVEAHKTNRNKQDPVLGIAAMASAFMAGEISIPWGDARTRSVMQPFIDELKRWRPDQPTRLLKQDRVMSMWFCWFYWLEIRRTMERDQPIQLWRPSWSRGSRWENVG